MRGLNLVFSPVIQIMRDYGALIETFAGDSIIAYFPMDEHKQHCIQKAVSCAVAVTELRPAKIALPDGTTRTLGKHYAALVWGRYRGV